MILAETPPRCGLFAPPKYPTSATGYSGGRVALRGNVKITDKMRLDWLSKTTGSDVYKVWLNRWWWPGCENGAQTKGSMRQAVDAAIRSERKSRKP